MDGKHYRIQFKGYYNINGKRLAVFCFLLLFFFLLQTVIMFSSSLKKKLLWLLFYQKEILDLELYNLKTKISLSSI